MARIALAASLTLLLGCAGGVQGPAATQPEVASERHAAAAPTAAAPTAGAPSAAGPEESASASTPERDRETARSMAAGLARHAAAERADRERSEARLRELMEGGGSPWSDVLQGGAIAPGVGGTGGLGRGSGTLEGVGAPREKATSGKKKPKKTTGSAPR